MTVTQRRLPFQLASASLAAAIAVAACAPSVSPTPSVAPSATPQPTPVATPTPAPVSPSAGASPSPGASGSGTAVDPAVYQRIEDVVLQIRGIEPSQDVDPQVLDEEELRERTSESFREDNPPEFLAANETLYRALGMFGEDESLADLYVELLGSQVAGFYDPETDELYVVSRSGEIGVTERVTYAHEFTHALQDQAFDLEGFGLDQIGQGDRSFAILSLIEGDATAVMSFWAQQALSAEELLEMLQGSLDPEQLAILNRMPPILRESLTFPYETGLVFTLGLQQRGGWEAVNAAYDDPPISTEQVMHPDKYAAREAPIEVDLPDDLAARMGDGWTVPYEDTFGEFQFGVWLRNGLGRADDGNAASAGWGGDRFAVLEGPDGAWALAIQTAWDSDADATEFETAATEVLEADAQGEFALLPGAGGEERWILVAADDDILEQLAGVLGLAG